MLQLKTKTSFLILNLEFLTESRSSMADSDFHRTMMYHSDRCRHLVVNDLARVDNDYSNGVVVVAVADDYDPTCCHRYHCQVLAVPELMATVAVCSQDRHYCDCCFQNLHIHSLHRYVCCYPHCFLGMLVVDCRENHSSTVFHSCPNHLPLMVLLL